VDPLIPLEALPPLAVRGPSLSQSAQGTALNEYSALKNLFLDIDFAIISGDVGS
jgi:hypothetical protein